MTQKMKLTPFYMVASFLKNVFHIPSLWTVYKYAVHTVYQHKFFQLRRVKLYTLHTAKLHTYRLIYWQISGFRFRMYGKRPLS